MARNGLSLRSVLPWAGAGALLWAGVQMGGGKEAERDLVQMPLLLTMVQGMGELHSARYTYENVFEYETFRQPAKWVSYVPGGESLVQSTTRNSALVSVNGTVEAGVDLRRATMEKRPDGTITVTLPQPKVYPARVETRLHKHRVGAFWGDPNIALKAERTAAARFTGAAVEQGILEKAKTETEETVVRLLANAGVKGASVVFRERAL
jgi:hypothetical protein